MIRLWYFCFGLFLFCKGRQKTIVWKFSTLIGNLYKADNEKKNVKFERARAKLLI